MVHPKESQRLYAEIAFPDSNFLPSKFFGVSIFFSFLEINMRAERWMIWPILRIGSPAAFCWIPVESQECRTWRVRNGSPLSAARRARPSGASRRARFLVEAFVQRHHISGELSLGQPLRHQGDFLEDDFFSRQGPQAAITDRKTITQNFLQLSKRMTSSEFPLEPRDELAENAFP